MSAPDKHTPYREASPPRSDDTLADLVKKEAAERESRDARQRRLMTRLTIVMVALPIIVIGGFYAYATVVEPWFRHRTLNAQEKAAVTDAIATSGTKLDQLNRDFVAAMTAAHEKHFVARPELGRCPYELPRFAPTKSEARPGSPAWVAEQQAGRATRKQPTPSYAFSLVLAPTVREVPLGPGEASLPSPSVPLVELRRLRQLDTIASHSVGRAIGRLARIEDNLDAPYDVRDRPNYPKEVLKEVQSAGEGEAYEVVYVIDAFREPRRRTGEGDIGAAVTGTAFLFDTSSRTVACATRVEVENTPVVRYETAATPGTPTADHDEVDALTFDLHERVLISIANSMHFRAGPAGE